MNHIYYVILYAFIFLILISYSYYLDVFDTRFPDNHAIVYKDSAHLHALCFWFLYNNMYVTRKDCVSNGIEIFQCAILKLQETILIVSLKAWSKENVLSELFWQEISKCVLHTHTWIMVLKLSSTNYYIRSIFNNSNANF